MKKVEGHKNLLLLLVFSLFVSLYTNAYASWHFLFAPYGWLTSLNGDVTVKGNTKHINIPFSKILKDLDFAGEAHLEAGYGRFTFLLDPTYLKLTADVDKNILKTTIRSQTTLVDTGFFYRLFSAAPGENQYASFELLGGARYLGANNALDFDRLPNLTVSSNIELISPIVGGRIKYNPTPKAELWLRGDVGGFNIDKVHRTWSATAGFAYIVHPHIELGIAYRVLDIDFSTKDATMNVLIHGPMLGIGFYC